jgi:hypothetical protein
MPFLCWALDGDGKKEALALGNCNDGETQDGPIRDNVVVGG